MPRSLFRSALAVLSLVVVASARADFDFLVAQTPAFSNPPPYFGVLRYGVGGGGGGATAKAGIAAGDVVDPAGLALSSSGELFVGNRNGNGVHPNGGSVSRFLYDAGTDAFTAHGSITVNATGTHGVNLSPTTGELFAANVDGPVSRFSVASGGATASGSLNSGSARDVLISPDGLRAYVTQGINGNVLVFDVASGAQTGSFSLSGANGLHFGAWRGNDLFLADYPTGNVYDLAFNAAGGLLTSVVAANAPTSISVAFSPDGSEMLVPGHTSGAIARFLNVGGVWTANGQIQTGVNMGDIQVLPVPEPAVFAAMAVGLLASRRRR